MRQANAPEVPRGGPGGPAASERPRACCVATRPQAPSGCAPGPRPCPRWDSAPEQARDLGQGPLGAGIHHATSTCALAGGSCAFRPGPREQCSEWQGTSSTLSLRPLGFVLACQCRSDLTCTMGGVTIFAMSVSVSIVPGAAFGRSAYAGGSWQRYGLSKHARHCEYQSTFQELEDARVVTMAPRRYHAEPNTAHR